MKTIFCLLITGVFPTLLFAEDFHVGPGEEYSSIGEVAWASLNAGDRVFIHYRTEPYFEKWAINAQGTEAEPIEIIGVLGPEGERPIIDGNGAITPTNLDYWGESRGIIKIGGSSVPSDGLPSYITIDNLEIRSSRPAYSFINDAGSEENYSENSASIYIEKGEHIIIRNCEIHDSGNGIFIGAFNGQTQDILLSGNYIHDNGIEGSIFEHNTYTSAIGITYEYNRFGPLREGALGNNLKDRSAGLVVRYNWIESGNRQLDLVEANGIDELVGHPSYSTTHVYGNILIEPDGAGNSQIIHYGGDNGNSADYRKGMCYFYNNTVISTRNGNTTLVRLSTQDESMMAFNNVIYNTAAGANMALMNDAGSLSIENNWMPESWVDSHSVMSGNIDDLGNNLNGSDPQFADFDIQDFTLAEGSPLIDSGMDIPIELLPEHDVNREYLKHSQGADRNTIGSIDIGAFEFNFGLSVENHDSPTVSLFPNPANSGIRVKSKDFRGLQIYSSTGEFILESHRPEINISTLANGLYFARVSHGDQISVIHFIKEN